MVEVFARLRHEHLDEEQIAYCRKVTVLWSAFFLLNGSISLGLAVRGDLEAWTLYNGLIGYILVGLLFAGELVYRHFRFAARRQAAALAGNPGLVLDPQRLSRDAGDGWLEMRLRVPEDLSYLQGHFDEFPVVAGVVQLQWISELASELLGRPAVIRRMEQIKFHQVMQPGQAFSARLEHDPARSRISYVLQDGDRRFASGRLILGP
jgi:3-hydroxymyristoyl/3-hydroxydecanoyl-(acyl carrier protein) dehydratase